MRMAFDIAMRGIRIRFGRSVVTITGVVFGIAFLMSILTGQVLRSGVSQEEELRTNVRRMVSFITAETGPVAEKTFAVVASANPEEQANRLLRELTRQGAAGFRIEGELPEASGIPLVPVPGDQLADDASAVLFLGPLPADVDLPGLLGKARQRVIAAFGPRPADFPEDIRYVNLSRQLTEQQLQRLAEEERRAQFRNNWIVIISLLVTVIGVSNAMLMSVTERFREIGTMKCLGALSAFVRTLFLIESGFMGTVGGAVGCVVGVLFSMIAYAFTYGIGLVLLAAGGGVGLLLLYALISLFVGIVLSVLAAIYPATVASNMVPASALRSNV